MIQQAKHYPKELSINIGSAFSRIPKRFAFSPETLEGVFPLYGRIIEDVQRLSEHKLELTLGWYIDEFHFDDGIKPKSSVKISVYGEVEEYYEQLEKLEENYYEVGS